MILPQLLPFLVVVLAALAASAVVGGLLASKKQGEQKSEGPWELVLGTSLAFIAVVAGGTFWLMWGKELRRDPGTPLALSSFQSPGLRAQITAYLETKVQPPNKGEKAFCAYELFGGFARAGGVDLYLWSLCGGFRRGRKRAASGGSFPVALRLEQKPWRVLSHRQPDDGSLYLSSVRRIFPRRFHRRIFAPTSRSNRRVRVLIWQTERRAQAYFARTKPAGPSPKARP